jgi:tetratricopeptide (TPR) repeat protein
MRLPLAIILTVAAFLAPGRTGTWELAESRGRQAEDTDEAFQAISGSHFLEWSAAVERHEIGRFDPPAEQIAGWSMDRLERNGAGVLSGLDAALKKATPGSDETRMLRRLVDRGVLLHTDIALFRQGRGVAGRPNLLLAADGRRQGFGNSIHYEFAAALLKLNADRRGRESARAWYRAVSAHLLHANCLGEEAVVLALWRESALGESAPHPSKFPDDEAFLFDYGCFHEGLITPAARVALGEVIQVPTLVGGENSGTERSGSDWTRRTQTFQTRVDGYAVHLEQAFRAYQRAVEINPRAAEARVRLGHVECARGNCGSGMRNMRAGAELAAADPVVAYYAAMFLGQAQEARGRYEDARGEYQRAAALFPLAQSPLLALAALADGTGDRPAAARSASLMWSLPADLEHRYDPWWDYDGGPRDGESLLRQVYQAMGGAGDDRQ